MAFFHGVHTTETPTSIIPPAPCEAAMPVYFGTAPVHRTESLDKKVNFPILCNMYDDAVMALGYDENWKKWTLCENIYAEFALFAMKPAVFVNVFDPAVHKTAVTAEAHTMTAGVAKLTHQDALLSSVAVKDSDGEITYVKGTDYTVAYDDEYYAVITRKEGGALQATSQIKVGYDYADPTQVDKDDIIGGINANTGDEEGLEVLERVYPVTRKVPGLIVCTGWSDNVEVAAVMASKAWSINGLFKAVAIVDIPVTGANGTPDQYTEVPAYKNTSNLTDDLQHVLWPMLKLGDTEYRYSSQFAALIQWTTHHKGKDIPFVSPSNQNIKCNTLIVGAENNRKEIELPNPKANYLNENGITTATNFAKGWVAWGNRNACYPGNTDTKDMFLPVRLMFNWVQAEFILTFWQKVDAPITRRLIETICDSFNDRLNGLAAQEAILGGRIEFRKDDNPVTNLLDGKIKFKTYLTPPPPAEDITNDFELDPDYFEVLFSE